MMPVEKADVQDFFDSSILEPRIAFVCQEVLRISNVQPQAMSVDVSTSGVSGPCVSDFIFAFLYDLLQLLELTLRQPQVSGQYDLRVNPELGFAIRACYVYMNPRFFSSEEKY